MTNPEPTQQAHDLLQKMSGIVDALVHAVQESRYDEIGTLLDQRDDCQGALESVAQTGPLQPESLSPYLEQIQEKDRRLEALLQNGRARSREGLDALAQRSRARQAYQEGDSQ
ncbi:MAG: hypothetical protein CMJ28_02780 [Phycisphaerae bacterium]|nr:hypothetical protein [Phycisphaerae bacterium]